MSMRSALAGAATTTALLAALGNPGAVHAARDTDQQALGATLTGFAGWDVADAPGDVIGGVVLRLSLALVLVALLCGVAGRSRSRGAAFLGGWGALVVAAGLAGAAGYVYQVAVVLDGTTFSATYLDGLVQAANAGASFGLWTGWVVGLGVAVATRTAPVVAPSATTAAWPAAPPARGIAEPPPWWAPTAGEGGAVRPGPSVFPPGGIPPAAAGRPPHPGAGGPEPVRSSDLHPSEPDATQPVAMPPTGAAETRPDAPTADEPYDPETTTTMPEGENHTMPMPRHRD